MHVIYEHALPAGWAEEPLGTLVTTKRGCSWSKEQERDRPAEGTIPVIRIPNIQASLDLTDLLHIDGISPEQRAASAVTKGWTLLVGSNGNPKRIGDSVLMEENREMIFASFLFAVRPKPDGAKIADEFMACWLHAHRVHEFISETSQMTTGLANMSWGACRKLPVRFPQCKEEQTRIAEALKAADDHIRTIEEQIRKAERLKQALHQSLFVFGLPGANKGLQQFRWGMAPMGWSETRLRAVLTEPVGNGISPQAATPKPPGIPTLNVSSIRNGVCDQTAISYIELSDAHSTAFAVRRGDFFVLRGNGNRDYVGIGGLLEEEPRKELVFSDLLIRVRFDEAKANPRFMKYLWQAPSFIRRLQSYAITGSGLWKIGQRSISRFEFALPEVEEQKTIAELLVAQEQVRRSLATQLIAARRVKQSLLQNLLTGRIRLKL